MQGSLSNSSGQIAIYTYVGLQSITEILERDVTLHLGRRLKIEPMAFTVVQIQKGHTDIIADLCSDLK